VVWLRIALITATKTAMSTTPPRRSNQLRPTKIQAYPTAAPGSVIITQGQTKVLCTASIAKEVPRWLKDDSGQATKGWVTAEYAMLPGSTPDRKRRGSDSRGTEIQRLIGRSLRAAVNLEKMPGVMITCDCDVLVADGGTRTASITGAFVALAKTLAWARKKGLIDKNPIVGPVAGISVGIVEGKPCLDLDYELDVRADVDMNVAMDHRGRYIEVQGTGERGSFSQQELDQLLGLATKGVRQLIRLQRRALD
jgi:ribonuclease PH